MIFGFAGGKEEDKYLGFVFGHSTSITLDESALLIERDAAVEYGESIKPPETLPETDTGSTAGPGEGDRATGGDGEKPIGPTTGEAHKTQFYGTVTLEPVNAKMDFATLVDEVLEQFTSKLGVDVKIAVEIQAKSKEGFDDALQRTVKENCNVLKFSSAEFEKDEE